MRWRLKTQGELERFRTSEIKGGLELSSNPSGGPQLMFYMLAACDFIDSSNVYTWPGQ